MINLLDKAKKWYEPITKKVKRSKKGKLVIFVSQTIDSLTSLRTLVFLLQNEDFRFEEGMEFCGNGYFLSIFLPVCDKRTAVVDEMIVLDDMRRGESCCTVWVVGSFCSLR